MKKTVALGLLTILTVFGFMSCDNSGNENIINKEFTITFDFDGGIQDNTSLIVHKVKEGETLGINLPAWHENKIFDGWYTKKNGLGNEITSSTVITSDLILYAKWISIEGTKWNGIDNNRNLIFIFKDSKNWELGFLDPSDGGEENTGLFGKGTYSFSNYCLLINVNNEYDGDDWKGGSIWAISQNLNFRGNYFSIPQAFSCIISENISIDFSR